MSLLLDTQLVIWTTGRSSQLSARAAARIADAIQPRFSVVSLWEIVIKAGRGRADFDYDARRVRPALLQAGYLELTVTAAHVFEVTNLSALHGDPFDRLLLAQARSEGLTLLTTDAELARYGSPVERV